jgi:hypothetical protein
MYHMYSSMSAFEDIVINDKNGHFGVTNSHSYKNGHFGVTISHYYSLIVITPDLSDE